MLQLLSKYIRLRMLFLTISACFLDPCCLYLALQELFFLNLISNYLQFNLKEFYYHHQLLLYYHLLSLANYHLRQGRLPYYSIFSFRYLLNLLYFHFFPLLFQYQLENRLLIFSIQNFTIFLQNRFDFPQNQKGVEMLSGQANLKCNQKC